MAALKTNIRYVLTPRDGGADLVGDLEVNSEVWDTLTLHGKEKFMLTEVLAGIDLTWGIITKNLLAPGDVKIGDYVFASRWSDCDWNDPWCIGHVCEKGVNFVRVQAREDKIWQLAYCRKITEEIGANIIKHYPRLEGSSFDPIHSAKIFDLKD